MADHWRKLPAHWKGKGPNGEIVYGKTWVDVKEKKETKKEVSEAAEKKEEETSTLSRSEKDTVVWKKWKEAPTEENLSAVLDQMQGMINKSVSTYSSAAVPPSAIKGAANLAVLNAIKTYDPSKGKLSTHVGWHLKKVRATAAKYQNLGRIPEHRTYKITAFKEAKAEITERLGYEPDAQMLADDLGWSLAETARMDSELRKDYIASQSPDVDLLGDVATEEGKEREVLRYIWHELTPDERTVFEYTLGLNGKPALSAGDIAKKMSTNQPKISRIRKKIDEKIRARGI
jgi:DNA-directed RNA polymerase sigma subunit (sigma70/sigma32)